MKFNDPREVDQLCWEMRQSDYSRGLNRKRIDDLFNGWPPYTSEEEKANNIEVNVNFLEGTGMAHDARSQFYQNFLKAGRYFTLHTDGGAVHRRGQYNTTITAEMNRIMKGSLNYMECYRSKFALDVLHGIGPSAWADDDDWCPEEQAIADIGIPARTRLTMKNLPFFYVYRSWTAPELMKMVRGPKVNPGWNIDLAESCIKWIDTQYSALMGNNWPDVWAPEKAAERTKGDGGFYSGDQVPTIDTFDFYFYADDGKQSGWRRRIVLDSWSSPSVNGGPAKRRSGDIFTKSDFLFTSNATNVADSWRNIIAFQFADLSAVAPFQYHSVRSLGFLLYAVCHLQNRLRCRFSESVFESLLTYFRVKSTDEAERALQVNLINRGLIDESLQWIPGNERYQVPAQLVELGLNENRGIIERHISSYIQNPGVAQEQERKNKLQVMAELNAMTTLVSAGLNQAYLYQNFENREIKRRFFKKHSTNTDVLRFQARCLKKGVPESLMVDEAWECEPDRTMGNGNKTMEMAIAQQLMEFRNLYDPEPQRKILRDVTLAITDDPARAEDLVPLEPVRVTDAVHDAQMAAGALMQGLPVGLKTGMDHIDYVQTLLTTMAVVINQIEANGKIADPQKLLGLRNVAMHVEQHIGIIAKDEKEKARVKEFQDKLAQLMNKIKGFAQILEQMQKAQQAQNGGQQGPDPKTVAKVQDIQLTGKAKRDTMAQARAQRQAERQVEFEEEIKRDRIRHSQDLEKQAREHEAELHKKVIETGANVAMTAMKAKAKPTKGE